MPVRAGLTFCERCNHCANVVVYLSVCSLFPLMGDFFTASAIRAETEVVDEVQAWACIAQSTVAKLRTCA